MSEIDKRIGRNITYIRSIRGMTQGDLCNRLVELGDDPVTIQALSMWESGKRAVSPTHMWYISKALEVMVQDLFDADEDNGEDRVRAVMQAAGYNEHERAILRYAALDWPYDTHALIELIGAMTSMPPEDQADGYNYMMWIFEKARKEGRVLKRPFDINVKMLRQKIDLLEEL